jgi:hypothetical protein
VVELTVRAEEGLCRDVVKHLSQVRKLTKQKQSTNISNDNPGCTSW